MTPTKPAKLFQRKIVARKHFMGKNRGGYWILTLECRHQVKLYGERTRIAIKAHCEKCSMGLVRA